jgi:hypothetical protein
MLVKIDIRDIVSDHLKTLTNFNTGKRSVGDVLLFFVVPLGLGIGLATLDFRLNATTANGLITALAVFAGLLFNLLVLVHGLLRAATDTPRFKEERQLIREIYANISFAILISLGAIIVLLACLFPGPRWAWITGSIAAYFLIGNFLLTLLMVLRRVHTVLKLEFKRGHTPLPANSAPVLPSRSSTDALIQPVAESSPRLQERAGVEVAPKS